MTRRTQVALVAASLLALSTLTACDSNDDPASTPSKTVAAAPAKAPPVHACYNLDVAAGLELSNGAPRVSCRKRHTSVTVAVGRIKRTSKGKPLPINSAKAQGQIARTCKAKVDTHVGGSTETRRLSRIQAVWFSPTSAQIETGARWFRCDLVIAGDHTHFAALPKKTRGLLSATKSLNKYGTCGTAAPGADTFRRVACSAKHTWRARASITLAAGSKYLAKGAAKKADSRCRDIEARRAVTATHLRWSFEWPTKAQWIGGQRHGLCWTPD